MDELEFISGPPAWIEWNGQRWYRQNQTTKSSKNVGHYRNPGGDLLHRIVWERANGPIPEGMVVHHKDHDKTRNGLGNLELVADAAAHAREHPEKWNHPNWTAGYEHDAAVERGREFWRNRQARPVECAGCGDIFYSTGMRAKYCNQACRARYRRRKLREAALS
jgi:hypothetical protein